MNNFQLETFRRMYIEGYAYDVIAITAGVSVQDVRDMYKYEKKNGKMKGLTNKRMKAKQTTHMQPIIEILHEDGLEIPRHRMGYAKGVTPQVTARAGAQI